MIIAILLIIGLALGSFVNALVWRLHQQLDDEGNNKKLSKKRLTELSISKGRSMCPNCGHTLQAKDLIPIISWLMLRGKCRYCKKPISAQYPLIEAFVAVLSVVSYIFWPNSLGDAWQIVLFMNWLIAVTGLVALAIYDIKWMLLPDRIIKPLAIAAVVAMLASFVLGRPLADAGAIALSLMVGGGIFWVLYQVSKGKWIGGGDVKLGLYLGLILASPSLSFMYILFASLLGTLFVLPLLIAKKVTKTSHIPFGPFLMLGAFIAMLWGEKIISWYNSLFMIS